MNRWRFLFIYFFSFFFSWAGRDAESVMSEAISGSVTRGRFWPFVAATAVALQQISCRFTESCRSRGHGGKRAGRWYSPLQPHVVEYDSGDDCECQKPRCDLFARALQLDKRAGSAIKTSFAQLRLLAKIKGYLCPKDVERRVIHAFINTQLDRRHSLDVGSGQSWPAACAARLLAGKQRTRPHRSNTGGAAPAPGASYFLFVCFESS